MNYALSIGRLQLRADSSMKLLKRVVQSMYRRLARIVLLARIPPSSP